MGSGTDLLRFVKERETAEIRRRTAVRVQFYTERIARSRRRRADRRSGETGLNPPLTQSVETLSEGPPDPTFESSSAPRTPARTSDLRISIDEGLPSTPPSLRLVTGKWNPVVVEPLSLVWSRFKNGQQEWLTASATPSGEWDLRHTQEEADPFCPE